MSEIYLDGAGSPRRKLPLNVYRVPQSGDCTVRLLGPVEGVLTHPGPERSFACPGEKLCDRKKHAMDATWKGYLAAQVWTEGVQHEWVAWVLELTEALGRLWYERDLRGEVWRLWRQSGRGRQKACTGELIDYVSAGELIQAFSVRECVQGFYHQTVIEWGVDLPFKPVAYVETQAGSPPPGKRGTPIPAEEKDAAQAQDKAKLDEIVRAGRRTFGLPPKAPE